MLIFIDGKEAWLAGCQSTTCIKDCARRDSRLIKVYKPKNGGCRFIARRRMVIKEVFDGKI